MPTLPLRSMRRHQAGIVVVEFALLVPLLILLAIPVFYVMWNVIAQTVITNAAREMANLAARPDGYAGGLSMQQKMDAVAVTTPPLQTAQHGNVYVTEIVADSNCSGASCLGTVAKKWRWNGSGGSAPPRPEWGACQGQWSARDGLCDKLPTTPIFLPYGYPGKRVFIAEIHYQLPGLPSLFNREPLYAWAIF
jgi:Flp pilus assembly protein TadG